MHFPPDFLDDLRKRVPISTLVKNRLDIKKSNTLRGDYWACCPFHSEKTPSFRCNNHKGNYYCFGCGASGDHFRFLSKLDGLSFPEAVTRLADMAGVALPSANIFTKKYKEQRESIQNILEQATQFFERSLFTKEAEHARQYISDRALNLDLRKIFRVGYAYNSHYRLKNFLLTQGICEQQLITSGLLVTGENTITSCDRFRDRIIFPIEDIHGKIVGFGGRTLNNHVQAKYLNSPETDLFHKGELLYNFARAKHTYHTREGLQKNSLVVVEGYIDVITLVGAGFTATVATLGTSLTEKQFDLLWKICDQPILCFDGDNAGRQAAFRSLERAMPLLKAGFSLSFIILPSGQDPDDIIRNGGAYSFQKLLDQAIPLIEMLWYKETAGKDFSTPERRAVLENNFKKAIFTINDESLRYYYLQNIRERLRKFFQPIYFYGREKKRTYSHSYRKNKYSFTTTKQKFLGRLPKTESWQFDIEKNFSTREATILFILTIHPQLWNENFEMLASLKFTDSRLSHLHHVMLDVLALDCPENTEAMKQFLTQKGETKTLALITQRVYSIGIGIVLAQASLQDACLILKEAVDLHWRRHNEPERLNEVAAAIYNSSEQVTLALCNDLKKQN